MFHIGAYYWRYAFNLFIFKYLISKTFLSDDLIYILLKYILQKIYI